MIAIRCGQRKFPNIKAVIFDKDGTLQDSQTFLRELGQKRARLIDAKIPGISEPLLMAFGIENSQINPTGLMAVGSRKENEIAAAAYIAETGRNWFESLDIARNAFIEADRYFQDRTESSSVFPSSLEIIKFLSDAGLLVGILSADTTASVQNFVTRYQLHDYIKLTMGVDAGLTKPDPELFLQACQSLGVEPKSTLMVGDSQGDIEMAIKAGAAGTIGICWEQIQTTHLQKADVVIKDLNQIEII